MGEYANNKIHAKFLENKIINMFVIVEDTFHKKKIVKDTWLLSIG